MRKCSILLLLLAACAAPPPASASQPDRNPWAGFAPGSWVEFEWGSLSAETQGRLRGVGRDELTGFRADGAPEFRSSSQSSFLESNRLLTDGMTEVRRGRDHWTVVDTRMRCTVIDYEGPRATMTLWRADPGALPSWNCRRANNVFSLPADVIHAVRVWREAHATTTQTLDIDDLHARVTVGSRTLDCVVATMDSQTRHADDQIITRSWRMWLSADMPGGLVRRERQCTASPTATLHDFTVVDRVRDFLAVR